MFARHSPATRQEVVQPSNDGNRFSLQELRRIHQQLVENKIVQDCNKDLVVEILRIIAEMVVYGDNKSELLFDFFCEKNMLALFLEIMWSPEGCPSSVHIQILQTLSILISCVKNNTSLYYLLSNNYINDIINFPHNLKDDESLSAQYASFVKSLSLRLNDQTVQFFFIEETGAFPLLTKAIHLLESEDPMIRISAQTAILNVYKVDDERSRAYALQNEVMSDLFKAIINIMNNQFLSLKRLYTSYLSVDNLTKNEIDKLEQNFTDQSIIIEDWLYYLQDILGLKIQKLSEFFEFKLIYEFVYPTLIQCVVDCFLNCNGDNGSSDCCEGIVVRGDGMFGTAALFYLLQVTKVVTSVQVRFVVLYAFYNPNCKDAWNTWNSLLGTRPEFIPTTYEFPVTREVSVPFELLTKIFSCDSPKSELLTSYILSVVLRSFLEFDSSILNALPLLCAGILVPTIDAATTNGYHERNGGFDRGKSISSLTELFCEILKCSCGHSLTVLQCAAESMWIILQLLCNSQVEVSGKSNMVENIVGTMKSTIGVIAGSMRDKMDESFTSIFSVIVNEEIKRYSGRDWKAMFGKMVGHRWLIFPAKITLKMALDYSAPITKADFFREELHAFLMLKKLLLLGKSSNCDFTEENIFQLVDGDDFLVMSEATILGEQYIEEKAFEMKGKKFLDAIIIQSVCADQPSPAIKSNSNESNSSSSITSTLTFGLLGSSKRQSRNPKSRSNEATSDYKSPFTVSGLKVLFVQDPHLLLLVSQQKVDGKSTFKIKVVAPLLYADAKQDDIEKRKFKLVVRSWRNLETMSKVENIVVNDHGGELYERNNESYLKPPPRSSLFEASIIMDTEQASSLAVQHIESRRKLLLSTKSDSIKSFLCKWAQQQS